MSTLKKLLAASIVIGLVGLAGCGSDRGSSATLPAGFPRLTPDTVLDELGAGMEMAKSAAFEVRTGAPGATALGFRGEFRLHAEGLDARIEGIPGEKGEMTGLLVDGALYLSGPDFELPAGKSWLKFSTADADAAPELKALLDEIAGSADPSQNLGILGAATTLRFVRAESRDGVELARYEGTVNVDDAAARDLPGSVGEDLAAMAGSGVEMLTFGILVDKESRLHRFEMNVQMGGQDVAVQADYRDWGKDVTIDAPDPDTTATLDELGG